MGMLRRLQFSVRYCCKCRYIPVLICCVFFTLSILLYSSTYNTQCRTERVIQSSHHELVNRQAPDDKPFKASLVILIISSPDNFHVRETIRNTWLKNVNDFNILAKFVVGGASLDTQAKDKIDKEESIFKDLIVLDDVSDSYQELTNKVLKAFLWLNYNVDFQHVLKVDDDSYVRVSNLMSELQNKPKEKLYWGFFDGRANVKVSGKWKETNWILCDKYLPYARGGGYVLSSDLVYFITSNHPLFQHYLSEDVSIGTWLSPLKIYRHHDQNFDTEYVSRGCLNSYIITHKQSASKLQELHDNLLTLGQLCKKEYILRGSYEYNWSYPPSKCCMRENIQDVHG
ncbi:beta-1,3-galactosyltransferase 6-like [Biomphalaria glabrata]|uniref:Hexosyltransferase n=1 Tax=Biomphalaria glabrata TaxID=6526 RepID=A0A9W2YLR4_BIOGL|nr:beta-1,3-galactosyltransferase 6-like [Biomphalaria glabrata]XP_013079651.2 beta-1,3-galactosyltransferase 6-like [Biomphalaria glabrata]XP_055863642.1 beta-1,3-galactosyltransferase 6-like [Biomphalaria glabrata]XP_055863643.1 beta-1,3-galactosyltransferase 6-like [Biomphalaria glabrata]XP_055863644.1 beta-1,3-galactosyltransferase 6-like [Biomphalaria glabrata]